MRQRLWAKDFAPGRKGTYRYTIPDPGTAAIFYIRLRSAETVFTSAFYLENWRGNQQMKSKWFKFTSAATLAAGMAFAQTPAEPQHHAANRQEWAQHRLDRMASDLNLTDAQKTQAQGIMQQASETAKQFAPQLKQNRQALAAAVKAGNTADIERLSAEQGQLMGKMMAIHSEAFSKVYQTLTPEQRVKADQMQQQFGGGMHGHGRNPRSKS